MNWKQLEDDYPDEPLAAAFLHEHLYRLFCNTYRKDYEKTERVINRVIRTINREREN